jgi:uncharacterized protein YbjT (DUF2867 family)
VRILLTGATGLIGSAIAARLKREGYEVIGVTRREGVDTRRVPADRWVTLDMRNAAGEGAWLPHLAGVDAVVNCAGVLQDSVRDSTAAAHRDGPAALWRACEAAGVRRVIHFSAMGVERGGLTDFSRTKGEGDAALAATSLDWVILRPSVVVGRAAYGGSALFRALASFPILPRTPEAGAIDVVQLDDVVETVVRLLAPGAASRVALDLSGPERLTFEEIVAAYRSWLGWRRARIVSAPAWVMGLAYRLGDSSPCSDGARRSAPPPAGRSCAARSATARNGSAPPASSPSPSPPPCPPRPRRFRSAGSPASTS